MKLTIASKKSMIICFIIIVGLVALDLITKSIIFANFEMHLDYPCIPGVVRFYLLENHGSAFGMFQGMKIFLVVVAIIALVFFIFMFKDVDLKEQPMYSICLSLIISGTLGNLIDRIFHGSVRDFLTFDFFDFPSFNFADMCMCVGVFLFIFDILFGETGKKWN